MGSIFLSFSTRNYSFPSFWFVFSPFSPNSVGLYPPIAKPAQEVEMTMYMAMESFRSNCACAQWPSKDFSAGMWPGKSNAGCTPEFLGTSVCKLAGIHLPCLFLVCCGDFLSCFASSPQLCPPNSYYCKKRSALPDGLELLRQDWTVTLKVDDVWSWPAASTVWFFAFYSNLSTDLKARYCSWGSSYAPCKPEQHIEINKD